MRPRVRVCRGTTLDVELATGGTAVLTDGSTRVALAVAGEDVRIGEADTGRFPDAAELTIETAAGTPDAVVAILPNPRR